MLLPALYEQFNKHPHISTDTRKIKDGSIFFALKGPNFNANTFAAEALKKGAAYCVVDEPTAVVSDRCILVDDVLVTLQELARHHRRQLAIPVIAIVGSNGKTTTKELLSAVLATTYKVWATPGNLNNHIGLPLTLLQLTKEHEVAVIEMGANHVGENELLCSIAEPTLGVVTNNGLDHLEGFGNIEGVAKSNSELYYYLLKNKGTAFVNANDEWLMRMSSRLTDVVTYAANTKNKNAAATYAAQALALQPGISFLFEGKQGTSVLSGDYNFDNIMAAVSIGKHLNVDTDRMLTGVREYHPTNNRSQWIRKENNLVFMDAYNANPSSMEAALRNFAAVEQNNKLVIMGDMFEMGDYAKAEHQRMVDVCKALQFEQVMVVGEEFSLTDAGEYMKFITTAEAVNYLKEHAPEQACIFIKGSRGMKLETLLEVIS